MPINNHICLFDIPGLEALTKVCEALQVRLEAHGGIIRRLALSLPAQKRSTALPSLSDLTPYANDIDLIHDGPNELTPKVIDAIHDYVPSAECYRWEVRSHRAQKPFDSALRVSGIVPVNLMRLTTVPGSGLWDPWKGLTDIEKGEYRYIRNGFYPDSKVYRVGRDLECFSALLYCLALVEANVSDFAKQPGVSDAKDVLRDAQTIETRRSLQENSYLRARLRYLFTSIVTAAATTRQLIQMFQSLEVGGFLTFVNSAHGGLGQDLARLQTYPIESICCSALLGGDDFRLPATTGEWQIGAAAEQQCRSSLSRANVELGETQTVLLASPRLLIRPGVSLSSRETDVSPPSPGDRVAIREFIHFKVPLTSDHWYTLRKYKDADLAAVLAIHADLDEFPESIGPISTILLPVPSICSVRGPGDSAGASDMGSLSLRCNALGLLENAQAICDSRIIQKCQPSLQIFVLGLARTDDTSRSALSGFNALPETDGNEETTEGVSIGGVVLTNI